MPDKLWYRPLEMLARLLIAIILATLTWMKLPIAHTLPTLVALIQLLLYLTLLVYPPKLSTMLLCDQIEDKARVTDGATFLLSVPPGEIGNRNMTVSVAQLWGTPIDKSVKVKFARDLAAARMRKIQDWFLTSFIPIVMVVALTCTLSILQQALISEHAGGASVAFVIPFLQGLIGLIPFVWVVGHLLGEVTCHRDTVYKALS
jgi:hypothetical protein